MQQTYSFNFALFNNNFNLLILNYNELRNELVEKKHDFKEVFRIRADLLAKKECIICLSILVILLKKFEILINRQYFNLYIILLK